MKKLNKIENKRWFIWTLVFIILACNGLSAYIYISSINESASAAYITPISVMSTVTSSSANIKLPVTEAGAAIAVSNLPDVKAYVSAIKEAKGSPHVAALDKLYKDNAGNYYWTVHVYEDLNNRIATFGWYNVYQKTGRIKRVT